jgi:hypothetical protein
LLVKTILNTFIFAAVIATTPALALSDRGYPNGTRVGNVWKPGGTHITIRNNSGGNVARFAMRAANFERDGVIVRFAGRCDSACTLYLGLPRKQTCIAQGASFRFHAPVAKSNRSAKAAQQFMYASYPGWVRNWIAKHGGMTRRLITMEYAYAKNFIQGC